MNDGYSTTVEKVLYGSFVKTDRLAQETLNAFSNTSIANATDLNIFVDLYSVLRQVFSENGHTDLSDYTAITSGLVNLCAHYRNFFKRLSVRTTFYLVHSFNCPEISRKFVSGYNELYWQKSQVKLFNKLANDNFELLEILCPYLPDIHFIRSARNFEVGVIIADLIEKYGNNKPNLIISKDIYTLQLTYLYPYTSHLYPKKVRVGNTSEDQSFMIPISEKPGYRIDFWNQFKYLRKIKANGLELLSPVNFPFINALYNFPERNFFKGTKSINEIIKIVNKIVGTSDIKIIPEMLYADEEISSIIPIALIEPKMQVLDISMMLPYYKQDPESKSYIIQNLRDDSTVNMLNAKFFAHNPIDLMKL